MDKIVKINEMVENEILAFYGALSDVRRQLSKLVIETPNEAKMVLDALDKGASVLDKLQPLLRQANGIEDRVNVQNDVGSLIGMALVAAERIVDARNTMKVIEHE